jgi:enediyne biosynthesis protein E4
MLIAVTVALIPFVMVAGGAHSHAALRISTNRATSVGSALPVSVVAGKSEQTKTIPVAVRQKVSASVFSKKLAAGKCGPGFVLHDLAHTTKARDQKVLPYDTNGSGLALGDLDGNGLPDIVLGALKGTTSILLNQGDFRFVRHDLVDPESEIADTETRAVSIVDADRDGRNDIVTTHTRGAITLWHGNVDGTYTSNAIEESVAPAYAMFWDDLEGDGDLDLVTASYDALLELEMKDSFLNSSGGGLTVYRENNGRRVPERINRATQTLAMTMFDLNGDGQRDLVVGNDFGVPDMFFNVSKSKLVPVQPFKRITRNTMGFAVGDFDGNGLQDLFATDMKPNLGNIKEVAGWMPLMQRSYERLQRKDIQRAENVLQQQTRPGRFSNQGYAKQIDATGWSWSAQFGDLDNNGLLDLYVVNGMIDHDLLPFLSNDELLENNVVFSVDSRGSFSRVPKWGLNSKRSGRSMAMADLNADGRLDVVVNNLESASVVYENQLCGGSAVEVSLVWPNHQNRSAFGSRVTLVTSKRTLTRVVQPQGGYLTSLNGDVHFGVPKDESIRSLTIRWPDQHETFVDRVERNEALRITRDSKGNSDAK